MRSFKTYLFLAAAIFIGAASVSAQTGLKGVIRSDGKPVNGATVTATSRGEDVRSATTSSDGSFQLAGLQPGFYGVRVDAEGYASGSLFAVEVKNGKLRDLGKLSLGSDRGRLIEIRGSVFFRNGTSVPGAELVIEKVAADGSVKKVAETVSSESGEFVFRQPIQPAKFLVHAKFRGAKASKQVVIDAEATIYRVGLTLDLDRPQ